MTACGGGGDTDPSASPASPQTSASLEQTPTETPSPTPQPEPTVLANLDAVGVSGEWASQPEVSAPYPFKVDQTMTKVIIAGTGPAVPDATVSVQIQYHGINARTGEVFDSSWQRGQPAAFQLSQVIAGFATGIVGQPVGSRLAIAITGADGYDAMGGQPEAGIAVGDTLLFIVDILDAQLSGPQGEAVTPPEGLPVVSNNAGVPQITIPATMAAPTEVRVQPLIAGTGRELTAADALTSHAVCTTWDGVEYYNDYASPAVTDAPSAGTHQGLFKALVGQRVGSRVLVLMPGSVAYPAGNRTPSIAPDTAAACVVDLLFAQAAG